MTLTILRANFSLPLRFSEISRWRGAWCELVGWEEEYFHNHQAANGGLHYRYPLLQYRSYRRQASFVALQAAIPAVQQSLIGMDWTLRWHNSPTPLSLRQMQLRTHELYLDNCWHHYQLRHYLPFNTDNFSRWQSSELLQGKIDLLHRLLPNHILGFAKGIHWRIPGRFEVQLTNLTQQRRQVLHEITFPTFNLEFRTQLLLPSGLGIGKGVSHGFGVLERLDRGK